MAIHCVLFLSILVMGKDHRKAFENTNLERLISLPKSKNQGRRYQNKHGEHMIFEWLRVRRQCGDYQKNMKRSSTRWIVSLWKTRF